MNMNTGLLLAVLAGGLALLLARENKLRRALQALCTRLLNRLAETTGRAAHFRDSGQHHSHSRRNPSHSHSRHKTPRS
jgi:hypothetical protein